MRKTLPSILIQVGDGSHIVQSALLCCLSGGDHHLPKYVERKYGIRFLRAFSDDLSHYQTGDVLSRRSIQHLDFVSVLNGSGHFVQVDVPAVSDVIKAPIVVLLDDDFLVHGFICRLTGEYEENMIKTCCNAA